MLFDEISLIAAEMRIKAKSHPLIVDMKTIGSNSLDEPIIECTKRGVVVKNVTLQLILTYDVLVMSNQIRRKFWHLSFSSEDNKPLRQEVISHVSNSFFGENNNKCIDLPSVNEHTYQFILEDLDQV